MKPSTTLVIGAAVRGGAAAALCGAAELAAGLQLRLHVVGMRLLVAGLRLLAAGALRLLAAFDSGRAGAAHGEPATTPGWATAATTANLGIQIRDSLVKLALW